MHFVLLKVKLSALSAYEPAVDMKRTCKRYVTVAQIIQFVMIIIHSVYTLTLRDCNYPKLFNYWILSYALIFLVLFSKFYSQTYKKRVVINLTNPDPSTSMSSSALKLD
ncbi:unnamed protein product [Calicophoron daubneyi]|uniref:Elongation of very long chain fatty acids protein n=1 Tax=Calicophoron daubneyi TaxID=300641 RepID=A0AAV2T323_CALDB